MNFFQAQDQARRGTRKMVILFILAVVATVLAINAVALGVYFWLQNQEGVAASFDPWQPGLFGGVSAGTVGLIFLASAFKTLQISGDGGKVARLMGGQQVHPQTSDADSRKLLNVVEEMSIASGVPVPDVYVIENEPGINAFAAGTNVNEAAIGVTRGCIQKLTRDELQGVIAHEFSHILNGDMRLNMRLIGVVFGILAIGLLGYSFFRIAPYLMRGGGSSRDKGGAAAIGLALLVVGAAIWLIGSIGVFFGRMIQASISRQREFLADASAVQFTRNPSGIRDALRKIGGNADHATVRNRHAGEISHMWFGSAFGGLFATHPPLPDRIKAIDPRWDGSMLKTEFLDPREEAGRATRHQRRQQRSVFDGGGLLGAFGLAEAAPGAPLRLQADHISDRVGRFTPDHVQFAGRLINALPPEIVEAAHDPDSARGLVIAMLLSPDRGVRIMQDEAAAQKDPIAAGKAEEFAPILQRLGPAVRMAVVDLCLPALRQIDSSTRSHFLSVLDDLVKVDEKVEPYEFALYTLVEQQLHARRPSRVRYTTVTSVAQHAQVMLSALAAAGHRQPQAADRAYRFGIGRLQQGQLKYEPNFTIEQLNDALAALHQAAPQVKQRLIDAAGVVVAADGHVTVEEAELLRAFAAVLEIPLPPFIQAAEPAPRRSKAQA